MTDKEKIKNFIENYREKYVVTQNQFPYEAGKASGILGTCKAILKFIESL